jgi:WD40 repeat protein
MILESHTNEVWNLHWSHNGRYLATGGADKRALVWKIGVCDISLPPGSLLLNTKITTIDRGRFRYP